LNSGCRVEALPWGPLDRLERAWGIDRIIAGRCCLGSAGAETARRGRVRP
jgi:hypothetical protein